MSSTIIRQASIVNEGCVRTGDLLIADGLIESILPPGSDTHADNEVDATGMLLMPGVIDEHVHFREPGMTAKADTATESRAAAAGGVTSYMEMPNTRPATTTLEALDDKFANAAAKSLVNYSYYFGATSHNSRLFARLDRRTVCGIKLFMGSSTGAEYGDAEVPVRLHSVIRGEEACYRSTATAVEMADKAGARLHVMHISTARELTLFDAGRPDGKRITAEVCLPHLLFTDEDYDTLGARIKCNPSIKTASDRHALRAALGTGRLDTIATDHAPHLLADKRGGALRAASGMPMLQFSLVAMLDLAAGGTIDVTRVVELMCHAPARLYHIDRRGFIRPGYHADIVLVANRQWTLDASGIASRCGWSPLEGHTFNHRVMQTYVNGRLVYDNGRFDDTVRGERLLFDY